ncbi:hypothetical protein Hanom_Chr03g00240541 [Helianthus anomalus]
MRIFLFQQFVEVKKQTVFFLQTAEVWSTSYATDVCRCGPQTADVLPLKKQTAPKKESIFGTLKHQVYLLKELFRYFVS